MKSRSFTLAHRHTNGGSIRWAKQTRSRIDRHHATQLLQIAKTEKDIDEIDIPPMAQSKPGFWAWIID